METKKTTKKKEEKNQEELKSFFFPSHNRTIKAKNINEALKKLKNPDSKEGK